MPKKRGKFQEKTEELAVRIFIGAIGLFPLKFSMGLGKLLARIFLKIFPKRAGIACRNLELAFPDMPQDEKQRIVRGTFNSLGRHLGFVSHFRKFKPEDIRELIEVVGKQENFDPAIATGRGILFFTGHFGSWEVFNLLPPAFGHHMNILVRRIDNELVEKYVDSLRTRFGSVTLDKRRAARQMRVILKEGGILGILADLNVQEKEGIFVDFFGVKASTSTSIAKLAIMTNAIIIPAFAVWEEGKGKYVVYLEKPIETDETAEKAQRIEEITKEVTKSVESFVRKYPEQWLWIHKRWNTRPKGEKDLY